ncbi:hypothetical protein WKK05_20815 [Nostoc sp. UHCC 0302]|uniref:hypothetical protein n=1 Tax=Nostoc sp. UHCC 0302 TaxID=3134896 RepID=UPI00311C921D
MDCKTATLVYQTENHIEKIREIFPDAWKFLEEQSFAYVEGKENEFDSAVKNLIGEHNFKFRTIHRDDKDPLTKDLSELLGDITSRLLLEKHFSELVGQKVFFSNICCKSHITADHELTLEEVLPIQRAAIQLQ